MPLRVLVVEDEASLRSLVLDIVQDLGHEAVAVADGESALETARADARGFDAAVIDLVLPGIGGLETARALRAQRPGLAAIISSGYDEHAQAVAPVLAAARSEGMTLLRKPYRIDELEAALEHVARGRGADQPT